jgi:hypothetical protein
MHFWKISLLENELRAGSVSQGHLFGYFLINIMLFTVGLEFTGYLPEEPTTESIVSSCVVILSTILGTLACYNADHKGDDKDFTPRYVSLTVPIAVRTMVLLIVFLSIYIIVVRLIVNTSDLDTYGEKTRFLDPVFIVIFVVVFYSQLSKSIRAVAAK